MPERKVHVGIVGVGLGAQVHIPAFQEVLQGRWAEAAYRPVTTPVS